MNFKELRAKHPQFIYEGFDISKDGENLKITFDFSISPDIKFKPEIIFPATKFIPHNLIFNLGMVELLSYWKATCSPEIVIKAGYLDKEQIKFWKDLLIKGLGEFFYKNKIDFTKNNLVKFVIDSDIQYPPFNGQLKNRDLILVSGGKDSIVTLETLKGTPLMLNPTEASKKIAKDGIIIKRIIDPKLLELNKKGYLNGHTPFSAYLAFLSTLAAVLYDYKNIVVSNEASSDEGNVEYHGQIINHQYSKSFEFEKDFKEYAKKYLANNTNYFSFLRSLNELQISRVFSRMEKYHKFFRSCNRGSKSGVWCGVCSKCLFTYLMLYPFLGDKIKEIFGKDLLDDERLAPLMEELLQLPGKFKPFECVGTKEEIEYAMVLGILQGKRKKLLERYKDQISILILGMGREGQVTRDFLKKNNIDFATADAKDGESYLDKINNFDIIIKSPGIPYLPEIKIAKQKGKIITSATQIFFDICQGKIIGVTGTKGKSTTAAMIYEVLKKGRLDVYLTGNIGKPSLDLLEKINANSIIVYEMSSFQLNDLNSSPHMAVITNLYPDHLDYHGSFENYKNAKVNIYKYQTEKDFLIQNKSSVEAARAIGRLFKIPEEKINKAIDNFKPLPHRLEYVGEVKGIKFYNDSLATNPHATIYGLKILGEDVQTLIAGGFDRGVDYSVLGPAIAKSKIKTLILFPDTGEKIRKSVKKDIKFFNAHSMEVAVKLAFKNTDKGKICLMSPASASFNLFKDYEDRGNQFKKLVLAS
ncbi:UDP-N-acetylmuramoyl-L-alanine--D-glutamate ligase [Candidatus Daviesbacteria bacterium]|nr:UDP-N-acetylmuramoyl-L-alanine--D-glutamate ligase [Candidatus Daviesbacteria bacterium]